MNGPQRTACLAKGYTHKHGNEQIIDPLSNETGLTSHDMSLDS